MFGSPYPACTAVLLAISSADGTPVLSQLAAWHANNGGATCALHFPAYNMTFPHVCLRGSQQHLRGGLRQRGALKALRHLTPELRRVLCALEKAGVLIHSLSAFTRFCRLPSMKKSNGAPQQPRLASGPPSQAGRQAAWGSPKKLVEGGQISHTQWWSC